MTIEELVKAITDLAWCDGVVCGVIPYADDSAVAILNVVEKRLTSVSAQLKEEYRLRSVVEA